MEPQEDGRQGHCVIRGAEYSQFCCLSRRASDIFLLPLLKAASQIHPSWISIYLESQILPRSSFLSASYPKLQSSPKKLDAMLALPNLQFLRKWRYLASTLCSKSSSSSPSSLTLLSASLMTARRALLPALLPLLLQYSLSLTLEEKHTNTKYAEQSCSFRHWPEFPRNVALGDRCVRIAEVARSC